MRVFKTLTTRLVLSHLAVSIVSISLMATFAGRYLFQAVFAEAEHNLQGLAVAASNAIELPIEPDCSLALDCDDGGILFDGNSTVEVTGVGIFSNSCITKNGGVGVHVYGNHDITCVLEDCYTENGNSGGLSPKPEEDTGVPLPPSAYAVPTPDCSGLPNHGSYNKDGTLEPGNYTNVKITGGEREMQAGLYCVEQR